MSAYLCRGPGGGGALRLEMHFSIKSFRSEAYRFAELRTEQAESEFGETEREPALGIIDFA